LGTGLNVSITIYRPFIFESCEVGSLHRGGSGNYAPPFSGLNACQVYIQESIKNLAIIYRPFFLRGNMSERKVTTDALETLGTIIDESQKRDAIHLAVEPVIAGQDFSPGSHITVTNGVAQPSKPGKGIGIVDPFLTENVKKGERFWFVMYPRKVHSLRHVWSHPDFPDEGGTTPQDKSVSEEWLRDFISGSDCPDYDTVMELINEGILPSPDSEYYANGGVYDEEYLHFNGRDAHGEIPPEFWVHAEIVLNKKLTNRPQYFSCSC